MLTHINKCYQTSWGWAVPSSSYARSYSLYALKGEEPLTWSYMNCLDEILRWTFWKNILDDAIPDLRCTCSWSCYSLVYLSGWPAGRLACWPDGWTIEVILILSQLSTKLKLKLKLSLAILQLFKTVHKFNKCSQVLTSVKKFFSQMFTNFNIFWQIFTNVNNCSQLFTTVRIFSQMLKC